MAAADRARKRPVMLLADAAFTSGKYVQGFPEYGPERMGAPITAYNRISDERCDVHSFIYQPDYVVVVDEIAAGIGGCDGGTVSEQGAIIINSERSTGAAAQPHAARLSGPGLHHRRAPHLRGHVWANTSPTRPCWPPRCEVIRRDRAGAVYARHGNRLSATNSPPSRRSSIRNLAVPEAVHGGGLRRNETSKGHS